MSGTERVLRFLQSRGVQRGVLGESRGWFWVAVIAWGFRTLRRFAGNEPQVVYRGELKPGEAIQIDHLLETYGGDVVKRRRWGRRS